MIERSLDLPTGDGGMQTFIAHPDRGGPHPVVLFLMDAAGIREELRDMARRLATCGYYVIMPNLYYRTGVFELPADATHDDMRPLMVSLSDQGVMEDCDVALDFSDGDPAARGGNLGVVGYCMSGQYVMRLAASRPERVVAAASFHGVRLVRDDPDSPHLVLPKVRAEFYFGFGEVDPHAPLDMVAALAVELDKAGVNAEVEVLPGLDHGFAFPSRDIYDRAGADTHWERLIALCRRRL